MSARPLCSVAATLGLVLSLVFPGGTPGLAQHAEAPPAPIGGRLATAALLFGAPLRADDIPADLASAERLRVLAYIERQEAFEARSGANEPHRLRFEQELASIVETAGIEEEAARLARELPAAQEWGRPDREAAWAEAMLRGEPSSPAAPYLYAFLATRYRRIFETMPPGDRPGLERQARKYRTMLERTRAARDPVFQLLAADLDGLGSLGAGANGHPRAYLPDT
jgi:hypothetical protein